MCAGMTSIVTDYNIECSWTLNSLIQNGWCQWLFNAPKRRLKKKKFWIYQIEVFICFLSEKFLKIVTIHNVQCMSNMGHTMWCHTSHGTCGQDKYVLHIGHGLKSALLGIPEHNDILIAL